MAQPALKQNAMREAVGIFDTVESLQDAMDDLETHGFTARQVSVVADAKTVEKKLHHVYVRAKDHADNPNMPRAVFVPPESLSVAEGALISAPLYIAATTASAIVVATGGPILAAIIAAAAAGGGGAMLGTLLARIVSHHHADYIKTHIERGGLLLWVSTPNAKAEEKAMDILTKHSAHDVHVHDMEAVERS